MSDTLTKKQKIVLDNIQKFSELNIYPPSIHQLCKMCGVHSTSTIHFHLNALKDKGFIHWETYSHRSIRILKHDPTP
jgi:repressor LexA